MLYGIQTHFNSLIDPQTLQDLKGFGFQMVRIDAQDCLFVTPLDLIDQVKAAELEPLVVVDDLETLKTLPSGINVEWQNEPDLALGRPSPIPHLDYKESLSQAALIASERGFKLWGPVISNLNRRGFDYLKAILPIPEGVGVSFHRYGDGTFEKPHKLSWWPWGKFRSRAEEVQEVRKVVGDRPIGVSEFGYPTLDGLTEEDQADRVSKEWSFWKEQGASFACLFQINDGPLPHAYEHHFGIRRLDGSYKPAAYTIPKETPFIMKADVVIKREQLLPHPVHANKFYVKLSDTSIMSVQPNGDVETRPVDSVGPWETCYLNSLRDIAIFDEDLGGFAFGFKVV